MPPNEDQQISQAPAHDFRKTESIAGRRDARIVQTIYNSMIEVGWKGPPIAVVEHAGEKYILNGHHRTYAARKAGINVPYRIAELSEFGYNSIEEVLIAHAESGVNRIRFRQG
ncbi:MAG TPA: ParB N-terminal domain-containing protein [Humisphaera sp.]|nr:ParB N-terminal domain-containing protein [Humisphaera sp.]